MAGIFTDDLKRRVREANNLLDLVQAAVGKVVRAGRNYKCCCPFHNEKTPSFNINPEGQYFKCFGCGKGGDVFTFIMLHERVEYPEAFKILAERAGIPLEYDQRSVEMHKKEADWKSYLYKLNDAAARFFREQLLSDAGKKAREYIKKRGLSEEICEQFRLGYAPAGGSPLLARLRSLKAPPAAIVKAGLATQRDDGSVRDFFFDRLMFPIADIQGRIVAFGGRVLGDGEPKYLNTRDTPIFSKTHTVYALNHAREEIIDKKAAIIVEGYTDVMMCHQFGVTNVVACLGTAITPEHIRHLRRVADTLLLLTDADKAGAKASERSLEVLFAEQMPARVIRLPNSEKDPCDFLLANGKEPFLEGLKQSLDLFEYKFEMIRQKHDLTTPLGLKNAAEELLTLISLVPDTLLRNQYRYEILRRLNVDEQDLRYEQPRTVRREAPAEADDGMAMVPPPESDLARAERELLRFLFHQPAWIEQALAQVDLAALTGIPEACIGRAMLAALGEGKLVLDLKVIEPGEAGGVGAAVAGELLPRLAESAGEGTMQEIAATQALCVALAETPPIGAKLDANQLFEMLTTPIRKRAIFQRHQEAQRLGTEAKLRGDASSDERAYQESVALRKALKGIKYKSLG